jgi:ABC-type polysaccharide/polyol phosphate transport system ATPase subunit
MSEAVITVENLAKRYVIGRQRSKDDGLRHMIQDAVTAPLRWIRNAGGSKLEKGQGPQSASRPQVSTSEEFWALRDLNFEVKQGEVVGIIGRNGAGKSTLLKILSRITEPTSGRIVIKGRVASLLEVGTGFHSELTGRENIFLNGAILGMTRAEIKRKFDEIVAFAEIEQFLDTPVKRYSSGMYVRLAFAVAAHLEPEILIVDEVLAVGDAEFQRKCLGKMSEVAHGGRTVLFVSHNMASLLALCNRGIVLDKGLKKSEGTIGQAVDDYLKRGVSEPGVYEAKPNEKACQIVRVDIPSLADSGIHISGKPLRIRVYIRSDKSIKQGCLSVQLTNYLNMPVLHLRAYDNGIFWGSEPGMSVLECELRECSLNVGSYRLSLYLSDPPGGELYDMLEGVCPFQVEVHHAAAWFGWRQEACCYLQHEIWTKDHQYEDSERAESAAITGKLVP